MDGGADRATDGRFRLTPRGDTPATRAVPPSLVDPDRQSEGRIQTSAVMSPSPLPVGPTATSPAGPATKSSATPGADAARVHVEPLLLRQTTGPRSPSPSASELPPSQTTWYSRALDGLGRNAAGSQVTPSLDVHAAVGGVGDPA